MTTRPELLAAQATAWAWLGHPGVWWSGTDRVAIVAETRLRRLRSPPCGRAQAFHRKDHDHSS